MVWKDPPLARVVLPKHYAFHSQWLGDLKVYIISRKKAIKSTIDKSSTGERQQRDGKGPGKGPWGNNGGEGGGPDILPTINTAGPWLRS